MTGRAVVMIRGINVGGAKKVPMAELRSALGDAGWDNVSTILATGNVVLDSDDPPAAAEEVEQLIEERFGVAARCMARSASEFAAVVGADPFGYGSAHATATDGSRYLAIFLSGDLPEVLLGPASPVALHIDGVAVGDRVIYQWCPDGILAAEPIGDAVMKHTDLFVTARNWNTVIKIQDRLGST